MTDEKTRKKALTFNAAGFFRKPIDGPGLLDAVAWALEMAGPPNRN